MNSETKAELYPLSHSERLYWRWIVYCVQLFAYPLLLMMRMLIVRNKLERHAGLTASVRSKNSAFIIYANHQSRIDPFIICASLPPLVLIKLLPFRFFVENSYYEGMLRSFFLNVFGGFPAHYHADRPYGLDQAKYLLRTDQSIVIFPQGMRTRKKNAKSGVAILAHESTASLIPIKLDWKSRLHCEVIIGKAFELRRFKSADHLMNIVEKLGVQ